jgi:hypothetical protein
MSGSFNSFTGRLLLGAVVVGCLAGAGIYFIVAALHSGPASPPSAEASPSAPASAPKNYRFAAQLQAGGVKTCLDKVEELSGVSMQGVAEFGSAANWFAKAPDGRVVSSLIGQKYGAALNVPYGLTSVFAAPASDGKCDGFALQVVPSPMSCGDLQRSILEKNGKILGNLAGVPLLQDPNGQVALVATAANACVLIGLRIAYSE